LKYIPTAVVQMSNRQIVRWISFAQRNIVFVLISIVVIQIEEFCRALFFYQVELMETIPFRGFKKIL